jgi:peptide-methionine (R)-S-oxide reductase
MHRRKVLNHCSRLLAAVGLLSVAGGVAAVMPLTKSQAAWKTLLPPKRYAVLFEEATEPPGSSPLDTEKRSGTFVCAACFQPLFNSAQKYDSRTGWPSFFDVLPEAIAKRRDFKMIFPRTEYHCARCGGHQGHLFSDGPKPTGLRYCNNGLALEFVASGEKLPELRS